MERLMSKLLTEPPCVPDNQVNERAQCLNVGVVIGMSTPRC